MEIDNKTKASVLRWLANGHRRKDTFEVGSLLDSADKLDPPEKPIHPHEGCEGMVVQHTDRSRLNVFYLDQHLSNRMNYCVPREPSKIPAFLCDGKRPDWVKDDDTVLFFSVGSIMSDTNGAAMRANDWDYMDWNGYKGQHFCVLNPVEVQ